MAAAVGVGCDKGRLCDFLEVRMDGTGFGLGGECGLLGRSVFSGQKGIVAPRLGGPIIVFIRSTFGEPSESGRFVDSWKLRPPCRTSGWVCLFV